MLLPANLPTFPDSPDRILTNFFIRECLISTNFGIDVYGGFLRGSLTAPQAGRRRSSAITAKMFIIATLYKYFLQMSGNSAFAIVVLI